MVYIEQTENEIEVLKTHIKGISAPYVEIGTRNGGSADLARRTTQEPVYSIDPDMSSVYPELLDGKINFIKGKSLDVVKMWDKPIGLLFIDGDHTITKEDFDAWEKFVVPGGYVLFHDYQKEFPKVASDCEKIRENTNYEVMVEPEGGQMSIIVFRKK